MKLGNSVLDGKWFTYIRGSDGSMWTIGRAILDECPNFQGVSNNFFLLKFFLFYILPHKIPACQVFDWFHFVPKNGRGLQKSPGSAAFNIYIAFAPDKGDTTEVWLAEVRSLRYFKQLILIHTYVVAQYDFSKMTPYRTHLIYI